MWWKQKESGGVLQVQVKKNQNTFLLYAGILIDVYIPK